MNIIVMLIFLMTHVTTIVVSWSHSNGLMFQKTTFMNTKSTNNVSKTQPLLSMNMDLSFFAKKTVPSPVPAKSKLNTVQQHPRQNTDKCISIINNITMTHGMPWQSSIDPTYQNQVDGTQKPFYIPFWEWQLESMKHQLTNLQALPVQSKPGNDLSYIENNKKNVRLHTFLCSSDEYKCIRMTLMDGGSKCQVFTSVWYPNPEYSLLPILGIDLLQFGQSKHLCIVDFQPIHPHHHHHHHHHHQQQPSQPYEHLLTIIRDQYPSLQGTMTKRFYDELQFFSKQILLGRWNDPNQGEQQQHVFQDVFPAYQQYVQVHIDMVQNTIPNTSTIPYVIQQHTAYDNYSAQRDPAHAMLTSTFGKTWADEYVYDILFPLSRSSH